MTINIAGLTMPHGMEHTASGLKDIVHGKGLAALTPVIYEGEISYAPKKFAQISKRLCGNDENDCVDAIRKLLERLKHIISINRYYHYRDAILNVFSNIMNFFS